MIDYTRIFDSLSSSSNRKHNLCNLLLHKKYRGHFEIIALLLEAVRDNCVTRFSIMTHANINHSQLKKYLYSLTEIGFIRIDVKEDQCFYRITKEGLDFLRQYYVLLGMLLNALARDNPTNIFYEPEYDSTTEQQQSATQLVTSLQRDP